MAYSRGVLPVRVHEVPQDGRVVTMIGILWIMVSLALGWFVGVLITKMRASRA